MTTAAWPSPGEARLSCASPVFLCILCLEVEVMFFLYLDGRLKDDNAREAYVSFRNNNSYGMVFET